MQYLKTKPKDLVRISLLSNAQFDIFIPSKVFISLVELSVLHVDKIVQVTAKLSPQNHFITNHFITNHVCFSNNFINYRDSLYYAYDMFNRYHHA